MWCYFSFFAGQPIYPTFKYNDCVDSVWDTGYMFDFLMLCASGRVKMKLPVISEGFLGGPQIFLLSGHKIHLFKQKPMIVSIFCQL